VRNLTALEWLAALVAAVLLAWQLASPDPRIGDDDFQVFYGGAAAIAAGRSPYVGDFVSPPWFAVALVPFTWLPLETARGVWLAGNLALLLATTVGCARLVGVAWPARRLLLAALLFGLWPPLEFGLKLGQNSLLVWALVLAALLAARAGRFGAAGALLALALVKPQLAFLYVAGAGIWAARGRGLARYAGAGGAAVAGLGLLVLLVAPDAYTDVLAVRPRTWNYWDSTVALPPLLTTLTGSQLGGVALYLPLAIVGSLALVSQWAHDNAADFPYLAAVTACATLLLTPYAYPYDAVLLQLPILWLVAAATTRPRGEWSRCLPLAALALAGLWLLERPADYTAWRLLGLLPPLGLLLAMLGTRRALS
jgi:Glycosyltransferase family 87